MAKRRRYGRKIRYSKRRSAGMGFGGLNVMDLALMGVGAGVSGFVGAKVNELTKGTLSGDVAQAGAGIVLYFIGKQSGFGKYSTPIAKGILIKTIGDLVEGYVVPMMSGNTVVNSTSSNGATFQ